MALPPLVSPSSGAEAPAPNTIMHANNDEIRITLFMFITSSSRRSNANADMSQAQPSEFGRPGVKVGEALRWSSLFAQTCPKRSGSRQPCAGARRFLDSRHE